MSLHHTFHSRRKPNSSNEYEQNEMQSAEEIYIVT